MAPTTTPSSTIEPAPRPSSRGAFELHVQSVRAARGLPHLVVMPDTSTPAGASPPGSFVVPTVPVPAYRPSDEKSSFESDTDSIVIGEAKPESSGNRVTNDDDPEPKTLARALFLYGFREYITILLIL